MASKKSQKFQHAAARLELEAEGISEARIQELERDWDAATNAYLRCRYRDCCEGNPVAYGTEKVTCPICREYLAIN